MTKIANKDLAQLLYEHFQKKYGGYVCIDQEICTLYLATLDDLREVNEQHVDYLYDWVLANNLAYEVTE